MADGIRIEIVSPERLLLSAVAEAVTVPGREGYFTAMADHAPMMTTLKPGFLTVTGDSSQTFYVQGGFAEVTPEGVTVLAELARTASDFSRSDIEAQIKAAEAELAASSTPEARSAAQALLDGWSNLIVDAQHLGPDVVLL